MSYIYIYTYIYIYVYIHIYIYIYIYIHIPARTAQGSGGTFSNNQLLVPLGGRQGDVFPAPDSKTPGIGRLGGRGFLHLNICWGDRFRI